MAATAQKPAKAAPPKIKPEKVNPLVAAEASLTEDLRNEIPLLKQKINALTDSSIELRHEIGTIMVRIADDKTGKYGTDPTAALYKVMPLSADGMRPMIEFARKYSTPEMHKLRDMRNPITDERLTWTHVIALTRVPSKDKAFGLAEKAVENGWSTKALNKEVVRAAGGKKSKGGRKPKTSKSLAACVADVTTSTRTWLNKNKHSWSAAGGVADLHAAETKGGRRLPDADTEALGTAITELDLLQLEARQLATQLSLIRAQAQAAANRAQRIAG